MPLTFIPHPDDAEKGALENRIEVLLESAEQYRLAVLSAVPAKIDSPEVSTSRLMTPRDLKIAYNWEEIARVLSEIRELPELSAPDKARKAKLLTKLAEVYEVLRAAKMSKLEAVRLALVSEASHLAAV